MLGKNEIGDKKELRCLNIIGNCKDTCSSLLLTETKENGYSVLDRNELNMSWVKERSAFPVSDPLGVLKAKRKPVFSTDAGPAKDVKLK